MDILSLAGSTPQYDKRLILLAFPQDSNSRNGQRRKPAIGRFGELTVEQARSIAQDWLADVRKGKDPSAEKTAARDASSVKDLCTKFIEDYSKPKNRPRTVESNQGYIDRHILGTLKVREVTRSDVSSLIAR